MERKMENHKSMNTLLKSYYLIDDHSKEGDEDVFSISLIPECEVYKGHFPGNPVSPGVFNIRMIKECTERIVGKNLLISVISQCKFSAVVSPQTTPELKMTVGVTEAENSYKVKATLFDDETSFLTFKGEMIPV
jgi:3-hydroxyacyl-[acyl-carrier-protein] dehydratase